jgi:hypothetical protein
MKYRVLQLIILAGLLLIAGTVLAEDVSFTQLDQGQGWVSYSIIKQAEASPIAVAVKADLSGLSCPESIETAMSTVASIHCEGGKLAILLGTEDLLGEISEITGSENCLCVVTFTFGQGSWSVANAEVELVEFGAGGGFTVVQQGRQEPERVLANLPRSLSLNPNPGNPTIGISYTGKADNPVSIKIYDVGGRLVRNYRDLKTSVDGRLSLEWDGKSDRNAEMSTGVYFIRVDDGKADILSSKAILLK